MLRIYLLQQWFHLSDPAVEEALYDSAAMRGFAGIDLCREPVPDETTVCKFRHLLERHDLGRSIFAAIGAPLQASGIAIGAGTIVEAAIISAASSTKNATRTRDPDRTSITLRVTRGSVQSASRAGIYERSIALRSTGGCKGGEQGLRSGQGKKSTHPPPRGGTGLAFDPSPIPRWRSFRYRQGRLVLF